MAFSDAIPVNPVAESRSRFDASTARDDSRFPPSRQTRQSVNVSRETVARVAKEKLTSVIVGKIAYNRFGAFNPTDGVGQNLSAKA